MAATPDLRPPTLRQSSRIPGGFESDDESRSASPTKTVYDDAVSQHEGTDHSRNSSLPSNRLAALNGHDAEGRSQRSMLSTSDGADEGEHSSSMLDEKELGRQLMDVESSFLPEAGESSPTPRPADRPDGEHDATETQTASQLDSSSSRGGSDAREETTSNFAPPSELRSMNTSALETMSSSPSYAAAKNRAVSRVTSLATMGGYETANEGEEVDGKNTDEEGQTTPTRSTAQDDWPEASPTPTKPYRQNPEIFGSQDDGPADDSEDRSILRKRPRYFKGRVSSQRSSYSSRTSASFDEEGNTSFGTEYALQSGGGLPLDSPAKTDRGLPRTVSLGSVASGISREGENEARSRPFPAKGPLAALDESGADSGLETPRGPGPRLDTPTDTVINQRVRNLEVPGTVARKFQQAEGDSETSDAGGNIGTTPAAAGRVKNNLTLKEQSSVIDKLQKENWKLKLKLYFMDQMLSERSDEAVSAMVKENVDLKTHKFASQKEVRQLKRTMRELEAKLRERDERLAAQAAAARNGLRSPLQSRGRADTAGEMEYLRERVETYQVEVERLRSDNAVKEGEKRRMAEILKTSSKRSNVASDYDPQEEVTMWKDLLEAETARREQFEEENRRLMADVARLEFEGPSAKQQPNGTSKADTATTLADGDSQSTKTLVEQLRLENAELKRDLGAQTSMLTSRNREKERLYQEIEDLKMGARRRSAADGSRSGGAGTESILERSASRAHRGRPGSRGSGGSGPRAAKLDDAERDAYEEANGRLRDQLASLKMENQNVSDQLNKVLDELEALDGLRQDYEQLQLEHNKLVEQGDQDILTMQADRDDLIHQLQDAEQHIEVLEAEAQGQIDALEAEVGENTKTIQQLEQGLAQREQELEALRGEMRKTSDVLDKVETDVQAKLRRIKDLEMEKEDTNREMETLEAALLEANSKADKQGFELQSRQTECTFLREEQDGFAIKIGDLETALRAAQAGAAAERDKAKDLGERLKEERHQREVLGSKEKQDVQRMMNDLNRDATTAKDETRRLKKSLETREAELTQWRERLTELETGLHEVLGETSGSKSSFVHKDLEHTADELAASRQSLSEKSRLLSKRDALLESHGLESRKLSDMLEKERSARRTERAQYEQWEKTHHHNARTLSQKETRISELEGGRSSDKRKLAALEAQFKEQLQERNSLLLQLWTKLSVLCGSDWQHQNSLIGGHYPTVEVVSSKLPQFSQTLLLAVRTIETTVGGFRARVRAVEHDLAKEYQQLEHNLDLRIKRLDRLEAAVQVSRVAGAVGAAPEIAKLRGENRLLRADLAALQKQEQIRAAREHAVSIEPGPTAPHPQGPSGGGIGGSGGGGGGSASPSSEVATGPGGRARMAAALARHHSTTTAEALQRQESIGGRSGGSGGGGGSSGAPSLRSPTLEPSQHRWLYRLRNMEKQLISEREGRLLDRSGARKRLEEEQHEKQELRAALERERLRHQTD